MIFSVISAGTFGDFGCVFHSFMYISLSVSVYRVLFSLNSKISLHLRIQKTKRLLLQKLNQE